MELSDLKIFTQVVSLGSITKAANELGYVQSNVTARIRHLENEMNTQLLHRYPRGVIPTVAGNILFENSKKIFSIVAETQAAVKNLQAPFGKITLGIAQTISLAYHSVLIMNILKEYPDLDISMSVKHSEDLISAVVNNRLDFALVSTPVNHPDLVELKVLREELVLVSHVKDNIRELADLAHHTVLLHEPPCAFRKTLESILTIKRIQPLKILDYGTPDSLLNGIMEGVGVSLLPLSAVKKYLDLGILQSIDIKNPPKPFFTRLICKKERLPSYQFDLLVNTLQKITNQTGDFY